jgi:hypothetical protein
LVLTASCVAPAPAIGRIFDLRSSDVESLLLQVVVVVMMMMMMMMMTIIINEVDSCCFS